MWEHGAVRTNLLIGEETWGYNQRGHYDSLNIVFCRLYTDL